MSNRTERRKRAHRLGLLAALGFAALGLLVQLITVLVFDLNAEQVVIVIVLELTLFGLTSRGLYLAVSRLVDPTWPVERMSYSNTSAWVDGEHVVVSTPSHLVDSTWSRPWSGFVILWWLTLSLLLGGAFLSFGIYEGPRWSSSTDRAQPSPEAARPGPSKRPKR